MTEQRKILDHILEKHTSPVVKPNPLHKKGMSSFEEPSSAESLPLPSLDSTVEPCPKPRTPKEGMLHPLEFPIKFKDYGKTMNFLGTKGVHFFLRKSPLMRNHKGNG
jgi:hypothetical protein